MQRRERLRRAASAPAVQVGANRPKKPQRLWVIKVEVRLVVPGPVASGTPQATSISRWAKPAASPLLSSWSRRPSICWRCLVSPSFIAADHDEALT